MFIYQPNIASWIFTRYLLHMRNLQQTRNISADLIILIWVTMLEVISYKMLTLHVPCHYLVCVFYTIREHQVEETRNITNLIFRIETFQCIPNINLNLSSYCYRVSVCLLSSLLGYLVSVDEARVRRGYLLSGKIPYKWYMALYGCHWFIRL